MALMKPISVKERKIMNAYVETGSKVKAATTVRSYPSISNAAIRTTKVIGNHNLTSRMEQVFDSVGLTEHAIARKLADKTLAKREIFFSHNGMVTDSRVVDDHHAQLKAVEMAAEIRGMKVTKTASLNLNLTPADLRELHSKDLENMLKECDDELKRIGK